MMRDKKRNYWIATFVMYPVVAILTLRLSTFTGSGLAEFIDYAEKELTEKPFGFSYTQTMFPSLIAVTFIYFATAFLMISSVRNTRYGEEYGSARFESVGYINRRYKTKKKFLPEYLKDIDIKRTYMLCSRRIRISIVSMCNNINILILGAPGSQKSRGFILPNIMQMNSNIVATDPKGELLSKVGRLLETNGYEVIVLDLKNHFKSHGYNPFRYFRNENDAFLFVNNMLETMSDKTAQKGEEIWSEQSRNMLMSIILYLYNFAPPDEQNFDMVLEIMSLIDSSEDQNSSGAPKRHELLFDAIPHDSTAYRYYTMWNSAKGRTLSSIVATLSAKMAVFSLESMRKLTYHDEIDILKLATGKVAVFMLLPDDNKVYNFLAGTLYTQMFQQLYDYADNVCHGPLPKHVRFYMDEFSNIALPDDYHKILSTSRSRNISFVIVLQDISQIEALYKDTYKTIIADCAFKLFLGSNSIDLTKKVAEVIGKETVTVYSYNRTYGMRGQTTKNEQLTGRELLTADELMTKLKNDECIFFSSNRYAVIDKKNDITYHPYYDQIADGKHKAENRYDWGKDKYSTGTLKMITGSYEGDFIPLKSDDKSDWTLLEDDEIEELLVG